MIKFSHVVNTMPVNTLVKPVESKRTRSRLRTRRNKTEIWLQVNELENRLNEINKNLKMKKRKKKKKMPNPIIMTMMFRLMKDLERRDKKEQPKKKRKKKKKKKTAELTLKDNKNYYNVKKTEEAEKKKTTESSAINSATLKEEDLKKKISGVTEVDRRLKPLNYISILSNKFDSKRSTVIQEEPVSKKETVTSVVLTEKTESTRFNKDKLKLPEKKLDITKFAKLYKAYDKLSFILYLNKKYSEVKQKRKQYAYKFFDEHYDNINKSIYSLMHDATKDIITKFMNNKKIIDFTSKHINSTKIHSVIREYTVS